MNRSLLILTGLAIGAVAATFTPAVAAPPPAVSAPEGPEGPEGPEAPAAPAPKGPVPKAPTAAAPGVVTPGDAPDNAVTAEPVPEAPLAAGGPAGARILSFRVTGTTADPDDRLQALLRGIAPEGSPFVPSGPADKIGTPIGTIPRLRRALEAVGYDATIEAHGVAGGVELTVALRPYDRVRYIFVSGNGIIRQDEIQRRITIRTGHPLPLPGPGRDAAIERERERLVRFLRDEEGYFEANVKIDLKSQGGSPAAIDLYVRIVRGSDFPIGPITITGNTAIPSEDIDKTFRHADVLKLWTGPVAFTIRRLRDDIAKVVDRYREKGYLGARISNTFDPEHSVDRKNKNVAIGLRVNERKHITFLFEGNRNKSTSTLVDELTFAKRGAYDDYEAGNSADAIQRYYQDHGYFFARVQWRRERIAAEEERIVFTIDEGPELKVRGVEFVGNQAFSADELGEVVTVRTFPFLGYIGLGSGGYVTARQVEFDAERLVERYRARGFPDVEARGEISTSRETFGLLGATAAGAETVSRTAKAIFVRFTIDEGPLVRVSEETFQAVDGKPLPYPPDFLRDSLSQRIGEPYRPGLLREDARRLERLMGDAGNAVATAEPDIERQGNSVRVVWKIKMGPRIRVGPIFVRGNFVTQPETILEQIPLRSGDYLTTTSFERGQRNLGYLQLFNNASPISFPGKDEGQETVPMVVNVEERHDQYNVLHVGGGVSTEQAVPNSSIPFGLFLRAGYDNRNLFGHGWNLITGAEYGQSLVRVNSTFLDRRFWGTLFRFDISGQYFQQATVRLGDVTSWGGSIGFSREMYPGVDASIHYNLRNTTHTEVLVPVSGADERQHSVTLGTAVGSVSLGLQWLRLDNRLLPTRGFKIEALTEIAPRSLSIGYAEVSFVKVGARSTSVVPLASWLSLRHSLRYDQGFPLGGDALLPKVERYFAGGDTTIRGFKLDRARIDGASFSAYGSSGEVSVVQYRPTGGNLRILQNIDLQFPISPPWYGSVFWDNGVVADSFDGLSAASFRHGVGVSPLIIKIPIGDLSFAWAWPLDPGPGDTRIGVFIVNIGLLF